MRTVAILDRGEAAIRAIQAVRELNHEIAEPIRVVAIHTAAQRRSLAVGLADHAVELGDGDATGEIERALRAADADAAWMGWDPITEPAALARACHRLGIAVVGAGASEARDLAEPARRDELAAQAAVAAQADPGQPAGRRLAVQVVSDAAGTTWALDVREVRLARSGIAVLEESASPVLDASDSRELAAAAVRVIQAAGLRGLATVTLSHRPGDLPVLEVVQPWLTPGHAVTEAATGVDLAKLALELAAGGRLQEAPLPLGHAMSARLIAEDPDRASAASPGRVALLRLPTGPGLRIDTGVEEGDDLSHDSAAIATIVAWGRGRGEALARLRRALSEATVVVEGRATNQGRLLELLERPEFRDGLADGGWRAALEENGGVRPGRHAALALAVSAIEVAEGESAVERGSFYALAHRGRPWTDAPTRRTVELRHHGHTYRFGVSQLAPDRFVLATDEGEIHVELARRNAHERRVTVAGHARRAVVSHHGGDLLVEIDGIAHRIRRDDDGEFVRNPSPAVVVSIPVAPGDEVKPGDVVAVVESMKMETSLTAPFAGRVRSVLVAPNVQVRPQAPLVSIEPLERDEPAPAGERVSLAGLVRAPQAQCPARCHANLDTLRRLLLGYDIEPSEVRSAIADLHGVCADPLGCDPALVPGEHRLLEVYADLRVLTRPRHDEGADLGEALRSPQEHLHAWLRTLDATAEGLPKHFAAQLERALGHYGITGLQRTPALEEAAYRLFLSQQRAEPGRAAISAILDRRLEQADELAEHVGDDFRTALDRVVTAAEGRDQAVADLAREVRYRYVDGPVIAAARTRTLAEMEGHLDALAEDPDRDDADDRLRALVDCPQHLAAVLGMRMRGAQPRLRRTLLEAMARRWYRQAELEPFTAVELGGIDFLTTTYAADDERRVLATAFVELDDLADAVRSLAAHVASLPEGTYVALDLYAEHPGDAPSHDELAATLRARLDAAGLPAALKRVVVAVAEPHRARDMREVDVFTFRPGPEGVVEDELLRGLHPLMGRRLQLWRLRNFELRRQPSAPDVYLFDGVARDNPKDERLFALAEVRDLTPVRDEDGRITALPELERMLVETLEGVRAFQTHRRPGQRPQWNRVLLHLWPVLDLTPDEMRTITARLSPLTNGLGIEMTVVRAFVRDPQDGSLRDRVLRFFTPTGRSVVMEVDDPPTKPMTPMDESAMRVVTARRRGFVHPAELVKLLAPAHPEDATPGQPAGTFVEHDLDESGRLVPVDRPPATNPAGIVVGLIRNFTERHPEGMLRVALLGDPTKALGSLAEPECMRINAALDLAEQLGVPLEWFAISAGAKIAMDSGTENMDWISAVLRRIIEFTQRGGEINVVVCGINVGAQPYWNAEATMLMHTRGILVMTPESAMVLTGKQALDFSGGVSADDNFGIGGYERIMGPNGQAQYWAPDLPGACRVLLDHYEHTYVTPGERFPRRARTADPADRDVRDAPHVAPGCDLVRVGDIFSNETNPDRKKPFDIRAVMRAVADLDHAPLERWAGMRDAEGVVVWDAHLGGWPVAMIGIESRPLTRYGPLPADGPERWTSGTLFPRSSKKAARAINAASGRMPLVVLANLAGFDGSPDSMREWQLEFGAEIGRSVVNFDGPIVFTVVSRYHGGAFVVFSQKLNEQLETVAVEGARASVIGGAPAAAVVFARDVAQQAKRDERITALDEAITAAEGAERQRLRARRDELYKAVHSEKLGEMADRYDAIHSVERAVQMGSVREIIPAQALRPHLIAAVQRGMSRTLERDGGRRDPLSARR